MPLILRQIVLILVFTTVFAVIHYYFIRRFARDTGLGPRNRRIVTVLFICLGVLVIAAFPLGRALPVSASRYVVFLPYVWMGSIAVLLFALLAVDLVRLGGALARKARGQPPLDEEKRRFLSRLVAGTLAIGTGQLALVGVTRALGEAEVIRSTVRLRLLPAALDGFTIVQLSDLHIGLTLGRDWLAALVARVNALEPDLIAITGDMVDGSVEHLREEVAPLAGLRAREGVFFVTGNHEYYSGALEWVAECERLGMRVLRNERVSVGRDGHSFDLAGVDDANSRGMAPGHDGPDLEAALAGRDPSREVVLLAHQPVVAEEAARREVGLVLAGHTHGGQIWPFSYLVRLRYPYPLGLQRMGGRTQLYISQGTGYWGPPMRLGTACEIAVIELERGE